MRGAVQAQVYIRYMDAGSLIYLYCEQTQLRKLLTLEGYITVSTLLDKKAGHNLPITSTQTGNSILVFRSFLSVAWFSCQLRQQRAHCIATVSKINPQKKKKTSEWSHFDDVFCWENGEKTHVSFSFVQNACNGRVSPHQEGTAAGKHQQDTAGETMTQQSRGGKSNTRTVAAADFLAARKPMLTIAMPSCFPLVF